MTPAIRPKSHVSWPLLTTLWPPIIPTLFHLGQSRQKQTQKQVFVPTHDSSSDAIIVLRSHLRRALCHEQEQFSIHSRFMRTIPVSNDNQSPWRLMKAVVATATSVGLALPREEHGCYHGDGCHGSNCAEGWPAHGLRDVAKSSTLQPTHNIWNMVTFLLYISVTHNIRIM